MGRQVGRLPKRARFAMLRVMIVCISHSNLNVNWTLGFCMVKKVQSFEAAKALSRNIVHFHKGGCRMMALSIEM